MHERALTQNILDLALKHAGGQHVRHVNLTIGEFSDERETSIRFHWQELSRGTRAQTAELHFRLVLAEARCLDCGSAFHPEAEVAACPACGSPRMHLLSGDDVRLESIDVE